MCETEERIKFWVNMSRNRINRLSLSPDPPATNTAASIKYNSGLVRQQQERNSPSYQSYKKVHNCKVPTYKSNSYKTVVRQDVWQHFKHTNNHKYLYVPSIIFQLNHDYENTYQNLQHSNGSISKTNKSFPSQTLPGLVSRRSAEFESKRSAELEANKNKFLQGTLQGSTSSNGLLNLNNASLRKSFKNQYIHKYVTMCRGGVVSEVWSSSFT